MSGVILLLLVFHLNLHTLLYKFWLQIYDFEVENVWSAQYTFSISRVCGVMLIAIGNYFDLSLSILQQTLLMKINLNLEHS